MSIIGSEFKEKPGCAVKYAPKPEIVVCPQCWMEAEVWSDEDETPCPSCGYILKKRLHKKNL